MNWLRISSIVGMGGMGGSFSSGSSDYNECFIMHLGWCTFRISRNIVFDVVWIGATFFFCSINVQFCCL